MKQKYQAPHIEIIKVQNEGVMASSIGDLNNDRWSSSTRVRSSSSRSVSGIKDPTVYSTLSEIEDFLNDLLTY